MIVWLERIVTNLDFWGIFGLVAQMVFAARFLVQWAVSEKRGESTIPISFWYLSIVGSAAMLLYGIGKAELPVIVGQLPGIVVYARNLMLIRRKRSEEAAAAAVPAPARAVVLAEPALALPVGVASSARQ
ncbi:MAG: lipid-A-disaccharide synthase N-terminal domain-containing protein [Planctomycetes bacterium]|nr:lipid-A-disaccharide synthase N-terminal domain-containing protein [Planctomycetota bacterium]